MRMLQNETIKNINKNRKQQQKRQWKEQINVLQHIEEYVWGCNLHVNYAVFHDVHQAKF